MKKILTASLVAMMAVTAANADIASTKYVTDQTGASETGTFTFKNAAAGQTTLQGAVNAIADSLAANMGDGGSVETQIDSKIDTFESGVIGTVAEGKTVTEMISDAQAAAEGKVTALENGQVTTNKNDIAGLKTSKVDVSAYNTDKATFELKSNKLNATDSLVTANQTDDKFMSAAGTMAAINQAKDELSSGTATTIDDIKDRLNKVESLADGNDTAIETLEGVVEGNKTAADATQTELTNYKTSNNEALAAVKKTAEAAAVKTVVDASILDLQGQIDAVEAGTSLADNAVNTKNIAGKAVTTEKIADAAVTETQLNGTVNASLDKADSAVQKTDVTTGTTNGTIKVQGTEVSVAGLGSAAYTDSTAYDASGSAAQALADAKADAQTKVKNLQDTLTALATFPVACAEGTTDCALVIRDGTMQWEKVSY